MRVTPVVGAVGNVQDLALRHRYAEWLLHQTGSTCAGTPTCLLPTWREPHRLGWLTARHLDIRIWKPSEQERVARNTDVPRREGAV